MAPKKASDKVTKPKATPKKGQAGSPKTGSPVKETAKADQNLLFLWTCFQTTDGNVNLKTVATAWNLKPNAARMRFSRLKAHIEKMMKAEDLGEKSEEDAQMDSDKEVEEGDDDQQGEQEGEGMEQTMLEEPMEEDGLATEG